VTELATPSVTDVRTPYGI